MGVLDLLCAVTGCFCVWIVEGGKLLFPEHRGRMKNVEVFWWRLQRSSVIRWGGGVDDLLTDAVKCISSGRNSHHDFKKTQVVTISIWLKLLLRRRCQNDSSLPRPVVSRTCSANMTSAPSQRYLNRPLKRTMMSYLVLTIDFKIWFTCKLRISTFSMTKLLDLFTTEHRNNDLCLVLLFNPVER